MLDKEKLEELIYNFKGKHIANYAAGLVVEKVGTACTKPKELIDRILFDN